jgi:hypothetical protein
VRVQFEFEAAEDTLPGTGKLTRIEAGTVIHFRGTVLSPEHTRVVNQQD